MEKWKIFEKQISLIERKEIKDLVKKVLNETDDIFFNAPASMSGKHHPEYALGDGGLVRHVKCATEIADSLLRLEMYSKNKKINKDYVLAAIILHDIKKTEDGTKTDFLHPLKAKELIMEIDKSSDGYFIGTLVGSHMGQWNVSNESDIILPKPTTDEENLVHLADYLASRKFLEFKEDK